TATDQITLADLSGLGDGTLTLSVTLTDPSSNVGAAVTASTSKDATAPAVPVVSSITTDSGANGADGITNDNTLSFNGTAEANATVEVFIDAVSIGTTTADATGQWSFNHETATLTDAIYAITATATDAAGNTSSSSAALSVTIDTAAPAAPVVSSITNDTGANGTDQNTNDPTLSFNGTAEANATVEVFIDAVSIGTTTADGAGQWSFNHENTTLSDASYSLTAKATDAAGNTSVESSGLSVTVDTATPAAPTIDLDASSDTGTSNSDNITNATTLKFNGVAEANADVEVFINDVSFGVTVADVVGAWTLTTSPLTLTGDISVKAITTDQVGNTGPASQVLTVTIDVEVTSPVLSPVDNATDILPTTNLILTFAEDVLKGGNNISVRKSSDDSILESFDVSSAKVTVSGSTVTIDLENTLPPATEVYVTMGQGAIVDKAGNDYAGISNTTDWSFTTIAASVVSSVTAPTADTYGIGDDLDFTVTMVLPVTITGTATIPMTIGSTTVNATQVGTVSNGSSILFRYSVVEGELDADGIAIGSAINLNGGTMKDAFGVDAILGLNNVASTATVLVDGVRPIPTISNATTTDLVNGVYTVFVEFDEAVAGFSATDLSVINGSSSNFTAISNDKKWSFDITPTADGTVSVSLAAGVATDNAGNTSAAGTAVTKTFDGTVPTVSSIARKDADQLNTGTASADFRVIFSEDVLGVDLTDFELALTGTAATLNTVTQVDAKTYDVNVNGISGQGTIGLNVKDDDSILDNAANKLGGTGTGNGDFTDEVYTTNFLPTDITSTPASISENNVIGAIVGALTSTDADAGDSHTYTIVSGTGDTDNASFSIDGTNLKAAAVFDFETKDSYSIRVKTEDGKGGSFEKALTITIDNVLEPSIFVTGDGAFDMSALGLSQTRTLTVTNDGEKPVEVRITSTPAGFSVLPGSLTLTTGASADVTVTFVPTEVRNYGGNIIFNHEGGNEAHPVSGEGAIITSVDTGIIVPADIEIYPNPASRLLTIDLSALNGSKLDITVINATGVAMFNKKGHTQQQLTLNVSGYEMGIYIVQFTNGQSVVRKKVIIKR
ncbi:Ig-like domain-containing protein, partial [Roseivirga sp. E12]|uniref:Ig-like domain-containing protein n=1 Tax=Roseivirga sp. E12 TaxID=2819237 RepID=UPI001ABC3CC3